jgi:16S rRNA (cytidine1402-2'-O)-methyltransferase
LSATLPLATGVVRAAFVPDARKVPAGLHFVATPIGAARDITLRALDVLAGADVLAAEDTRTLRHLMEIHGIALQKRPLIALHEHNWEAARPKLMRALADGKSVAYASEAGTPLVADPGYQLSRAAIDAGIPVIAAPGASAVLCALMVSGLPSDRFLFAGFPPATAKARLGFLSDLAPQQATVILYESPKRVLALLTALATSHGSARRIVLCRELTKRFEEVIRGSVAEVTAQVTGRDIKGEIVVLIDRAPVAAPTDDDLATALQAAMKRMSLKDAAAEVATQFGIAKRDAYQMALALGGPK